MLLLTQQPFTIIQTTTYYRWTDEDGTEHYFREVEEEDKSKKWKDESGLEAGYAYMLRDAARRYALLGWLAVYPTIRGGGTGAQFLELIKARYARYECVFIEVTEYPELEKARRLAGFYKRHGWCETGIPYAIGGRETLLLHRGEAPQRADLRGVLEAVYAPMYGPKLFAKHVSLP